MDSVHAPSPAIGTAMLEPAVRRAIRTRQANNKLRNIHHHAFRCRDAEETRAFYEGILQMPLVMAVVMDRHPITQAPDPYCHLFFEMGDGNCIAFFDYPAELKERTFAPDTGFDHHVAIEVEGDEVVREYRTRLEQAGVPCMYIDHGVYHSLYFNDPNGLNCELVSRVPATYEHELEAARTAHEDLRRWMASRPRD